uniref:Secreted protein n=1 Tax=Lepeophtheirus salmonis TaxID=72036 RepID=A0A0K2TEP1_LEPSM
MYICTRPNPLISLLLFFSSASSGSLPLSSYFVQPFSSLLLLPYRNSPDQKNKKEKTVPSLIFLQV